MNLPTSVAERIKNAAQVNSLCFTWYAIVLLSYLLGSLHSFGIG